MAFQEYVAAVEQCQERVKRITEQIRALVPQWRLAPVVDAFQADDDLLMEQMLRKYIDRIGWLVIFLGVAYVLIAN